jgi:hypothetical protein
MKRGQAAMEYLSVMGFALLLIIPIIIVFFSQSQDVTDQLSMNQVRSIGRDIVTSAEKIYYLGEPSQTILKVYMPSKILNIVVQQHALVFNMSINNAVSEVVFASNVNLTGNISAQSGIRYIKVKAVGGEVNLSDA